MAEPPLDSILGAGVSSQISEVSREEILRQIFGEVGELIDDFTCAAESTVLIHGRLYVTSKFICFYSNLFGLEKKIRIPYSHIKEITKENTAMVIPNAIAISTDKKSYIFRSFWDRDECHRMLNLFLQRFRAKEPLRPGAFSAENVSPPTSARRSSASMAMLTDAKEANMFGSAPLPAATFSPTNSNSTSISQLAATSLDAEAEPVIRDRRGSARLSVIPEVVTVDGKEVQRSSQRLNSDPLVATRRSSKISLDQLNNDEVMDYETGVRPDSIRLDNTKIDWSMKYEQELTKVRLKLNVVQDQILNISLDDFYKLFIDDKAPISIKRYHEMVKDTNLVLSPWEKLSESLGVGREMRFFKPVNLPGLASTRGIKVQRCIRFDTVGLIVCSSTRLEDVPAADTFSVDDVLAVKSLGGNKVSFEITFQVSFVKSTYMKYIIERSTNGEMSKWLENFATHLKKSVEDFRSGVISLTGENVVETKEIPAVSSVAVVATDTKSVEQLSPKDTPVHALPPTTMVATYQRDHLVILLLVIVIFLLFLDFFRWKSMDNQIGELLSKVSHIESLIKSLSDTPGN